MKNRFLPLANSKLKLITLIVTIVFLFSFVSTAAQAWLWGTKKIDREEFEKIISKLLIYKDPDFSSYNDVFRLYYTNPKELLDALNKEIKITPEMKKIADIDIGQEDLNDLTYGRYILNAIYEEELIEGGARIAFAPDQANGKFFANLADNLADWKSQSGGFILEKTLEGAFLVVGSPGLSIGISTLGLATNLSIIRLGIKKINERFYERGLWHYLQCRKQLGYDHSSAWDIAKLTGAGAITNENEMQTEKYFKSLWDRYGENISDDGLKEDFKAKQRKKLKALFLYALGAQPHPIITSSLKITPPPYSVGDKIKAEFTITNRGNLPISLKTIIVGGRYGDKEEIIDFTKRYDIKLDIDESYSYRGTLTLTKTGKYHFFCTYQTVDGNWNPNIDLTSGLTDEDRVEDIIVKGEIISSQSAIREAVEELRPFFDLSTPENTLRSFYESLYLGRSHQIKKCWSSRSPAFLVEAIAAAAETTQVEEVIKNLMRIIGTSQEEQQNPKAIKQILREYLSSIRYQTSQISHNSCYVTAVEKAGKETYTGIYKLVKENSNWKILYQKDWEENEAIMALILPEKQKEAKAEQTKKTEEKAETPDGRKANELYVKANLLINEGQRATIESYAEALEKYKSALKNFEEIISKYPSSERAVDIIKEEQIEKTKNMISRLELLAKAEKSPFWCAFYLIKKWYTGGGDPRQEFDEVSSIAIKYAETGQKDKALKILDELLSKAKAVEDSEYRGGALPIVATRYAEIGEFEQALRIAERNAILIPLPTNHAELGQLDRALKLVQAAGSPRSKVWALVEIAGRYAQLGQENKAEQTFAEALAIAQEGWDWVYSRTWALLKIASKYAELGQRNKALQVLQEAFEAAKLLTSEREEYLAEIAIEYAKLNQFEQAFGVVKAIAWDRTRALVEIAGRYIEIGQENKATTIFDQALKEDGNKARVLIQIASKYAELGQKEKALETLDKAITSDRYLAEIARKYAELGQPDKALKIAEKLSETDTPSSWAKWQTFGDIAVKYAELGQFERVHQILRQMRYEEKSTGGIGGSRVGAALEYTLCKLAPTWAKLGKFEEALQTTEKIPSEIRKAKTLMEIDLEYAQLGREVKESEKKILHRIVRDTHSK